MPSDYQHVKAWRAKNKDKVNEQARRRLARKRQQIYAVKRAWREKNIDHVRKKDAEYARKRRTSAAYKDKQRERHRRWRDKQEQKQVELAGRPRPDLCELCGESIPHSCGYKTVFDHCHQCGAFRGWLCDRCNRTLGTVKDNPALLRKMADYLEYHNGKTDECTAQ